MADRFFPNVMPDFIAEATAETQDKEEDPVVSATQDSLMKLLSMPYPSLSQLFKCAALDLKETVSISPSFARFLCSRAWVYFYAYQVYVDLFQIMLETWGMTGQHVQDFTLYCGTLGTAFFLFRAYLVTNNHNDLALSSQIVKACDSASINSRFSPHSSYSLALNVSNTCWE